LFSSASPLKLEHSACQAPKPPAQSRASRLQSLSSGHYSAIMYIYRTLNIIPSPEASLIPFLAVIHVIPHACGDHSVPPLTLPESKM
jgi:hypothetical protein